MLLRRCERSKNGKRRTYWALVESYRTARGSRQRVVAYLGELKPSEENGWARLGAHLEGKNRKQQPQLSLFDPPPEPAASQSRAFPKEEVRVRLSGVQLDRLRDFGGVWLAWGLWEMLGLDELLKRQIEAGSEEVSWATVAAILAIARFCEPASEPRGPRRRATHVAARDCLDQKRRHRAPAQTADGTEKTIRLRQVTEPDPAQAVLLHRLGLTLPRRLRRFDTLTTPM